jgi:bifunctional non-homologous end joining protein LigD
MAKATARFITPMLLLRADTLPDDGRWEYQLKLDGYRAIAFKTGGQLHLRSRNDSDFSGRYPAVLRGLANLPYETVIDGELVAFDEEGRPSFAALQNASSAVNVTVIYYVFDLLLLSGRDVMAEPLEQRRQRLEQHVLPRLGEPCRYAGPLDAPLPVLIESVKAQGLEGLVAKRHQSRYEPGQRSGAWLKMRINQGQEFVIGGYTRGTTTFDALIFGYYEGDDLMYVARTRSGFTATTRAALFRRVRPLETTVCPFVNLPEEKSGRWGQGLTKAKMADCQWLRPELVGQFEFLEWTVDNHLRHSRFVALRDDRRPRQVRREPVR